MPAAASALASDCSVARGIQGEANTDLKKAIANLNKAPNEGEEAVKKAQEKVKEAQGNVDHWNGAVAEMCRGEGSGF